MRQQVLERLGANLRDARQERRISQEKLAHVAGLDRTYVGGVERGERNISVVNLVRIAKALGVPATELLRGIT